MREEDEVAEELTERIGFTMKETKKEDEYHAKVSNLRNYQLDSLLLQVRMEVVDSDSEPEWEKMQIQKAMSGQQVASFT